MTFRHRAGVSPYTSSFDLAETCVFGKQSLGSIHCGPLELPAAKAMTLPGRPFSRSYGTILPSSLTRVLSISLVCSTCLPVSVLVRARFHSLEAFLGGMESTTCHLTVTDIPSQTYELRIFLELVLQGCPRTTNAWVRLSFPVPPLVIARKTRYRNINLLSIAYA